MDRATGTEASTEARAGTHPRFTGQAAHCPACYAFTFAVALECAYDNMADAGLGVADHDEAAVWARSYVVDGVVSTYYCHRHNPINAGGVR